MARQAAAAAPAPRTPEQRAGIYLRIGLDEAAKQLGRPVHVIEGMSSMFMGLALGKNSPGADPTRPVVRVVYQDSQGRMIFLDQQRIRGRPDPRRRPGTSPAGPGRDRVAPGWRGGSRHPPQLPRPGQVAAEARASSTSRTRRMKSSAVKGLWRKPAAPRIPAAEHLVVGIARDVEHLQIRPPGHQLFRQLPAPHLRHHHVGHQQMDRPLVALGQSAWRRGRAGPPAPRGRGPSRICRTSSRTPSSSSTTSTVSSPRSGGRLLDRRLVLLPPWADTPSPWCPAPARSTPAPRRRSAARSRRRWRGPARRAAPGAWRCGTARRDGSAVSASIPPPVSLMASTT